MTRADRPEILDCEDLYIISEKDIANIASDMYVDLREELSDEDATVAVDIAFQRLTDDYYYE